MISIFRRTRRDALSADAARGVLAALDKAQAVISFELNGKIIDANANFLAALEYDRDEIIGEHHRMFVDPSDAASPEYDEFWRKLGSGAPHSGEYRRIAKSGREIWIEASYNPVFDGSGKLVKIVKFAIDVTEKKMQAANSAGQIAAISRSQAVIEFDLDGTIRTANENFLNAMGYRLDEIVGKHHRIFVDPVEASGADYAEFWQALGSGEFRASEYKRLQKGGGEIWIQATYNPIFDQNGRPFKVVKFATDITAQKSAVFSISKSLKSLAEGDLSATINDDLGGDFAALRDAYNDTVNRLRELVGEIQRSTGKMGASVETISRGAAELAAGAETQAAALEETAATMEEMSASVKANADNAAEINVSVKEATESAERGNDVVRDAVEAMDSIENSSQRIVEIISVIESIAFQTNLLALNAAVEAARAGDAGKGFAVVASEVRTLAQRSSEAAKDIAKLIDDSTKSVSAGAALVRQTGEALTGIEAAIVSVVSKMGEIAAASREQSSGVEEISSSVSHLDQNTQQNAALAENTAAQVRSLADEAAGLQRLIAFFQFEATAAGVASERSAA